MEKIQLNTVVRDPKTEPPAKLKRTGMIPAELYGHGIDNVHLSVSKNEFEKVLRKAGESTIVEVATPTGKRNALIKDVQRHFLTSEPIHVDLHEVSLTEKITAPIELEFVGESHAVKALGGTLVTVLSEVEVEALPLDLPHNLTVDISALKSFDDILEVRDIKLPAKVEMVTPLDEVVAKVQEPRDVEAELAEPVGEVNLEEAVEGIAEKKPAAEGEEETKE